MKIWHLKDQHFKAKIIKGKGGLNAPLKPSNI